jgi:uncharacterized iron-regulated membrane protein
MVKNKLRSLLLAAHLYIGISVSLVFVLAGLTGSALVFYVEIDRLLNPELVIKHSQFAQPKTYQEVYEVLRKEFPDRQKSWRFELPVSPDKPVMARYYKPIEKEHLLFAPLVVAVDPFSLKVINARFWGEYFVTWIYDLHYTLLMDASGRLLMAVLGVLFLATIIIGLYLWWPKSAKWKQALKLVPRSAAKKKIYDIHTITGFYSFSLLLALIVTGVVLSKPDWIKQLLDNVSSVREAPIMESTLGSKSITLDKALDIAQQRYPESTPRWIETPDGKKGVFLVRLRVPSEPGNRFPKTQVWIDQYSGEILYSWSGLQRSAGQTFLDWMHPIHSGEAFGLLGRVIIFISGFLPLILWITGIIRWRHKSK